MRLRNRLNWPGWHKPTHRAHSSKTPRAERTPLDGVQAPRHRSFETGHGSRVWLFGVRPALPLPTARLAPRAAGAITSRTVEMLRALPLVTQSLFLLAAVLLIFGLAIGRIDTQADTRRAVHPTDIGDSFLLVRSVNVSEVDSACAPEDDRRGR